MSVTLRVLLTLLAAATAAFVAIDPVGIPEWVSAIVAAMAVGFGAIGIIPPQMSERKVTARDGQTLTTVYAKRKSRSSWG